MAGAQGNVRVANLETVGILKSTKNVSAHGTRDTNKGLQLTALELLSNYKVYLFYFDRGLGKEKYSELKTQLDEWGQKTGGNLLVGFWDLADPRYAEVRDMFEITKTPAIVLAGQNGLAAVKCGTGGNSQDPKAWRSAYLTIADDKLLSNNDEIINCLDRVYNLLLANRVWEALAQTKRETNRANIIDVIRKMTDKVGSIGKFVDEHDIKIGIASFSVELTLAKNGGQ